MRWAARRQLLILCWCARKHGCHTFRIDVEGQEYQRLVAWVCPLVHEGVRFIDQGTRSPFFCLTVDRVGPDAGDDKYRAAPDRWCGGLEGICSGNVTRVRLRS